VIPLRAACFSLVGLVCVSSQAQRAVELPFGTDRFLRAFYNEPSREVRWELTHPIDWEAKARAYLKTFNIERPTPAQIRRLKENPRETPGEALLEFVAPLEPRVAQTSYVLLSGDKVTPVHPTQLKAVAVLQYDSNYSHLRQKNFTGEVAGNPDRAVSDAAFVIATRASDITEVRQDANFKVQKAGDRGREIICTLEESGRTLSWTGRFDVPTELERTLSFRLPEGRFLLVKWKPDLSNCAFQYVLFSVGADLKPIAWNLYGCDV
jgi:hypothetical protein